MKLATRPSFRQAPHVRRVGFVFALWLASFAADANAAPSSNPAFLGIQMQSRGNVGCEVSAVTRGSSAEDAGLREFDLIVAIDGVPTPRCDLLQTEIISKSPGQVVRLDVRRSERVVITATLSTRAEVLHRRLVGQPMESIEASDADDDKHELDLAVTRGKTTVLGWFLLDGCSGCSAVFDRVADGIAQRLKTAENPPALLAVTSLPASPSYVMPGVPAAATAGPPRKRYGFTSTVPLALTSKQAFEELAIDDPLRIHFVVVDCRGIVRFVAPIAPGSDDIDAAVDEVLAAVEQAENSRTRLRGATARRDELERPQLRDVDSLRPQQR